MWICVASECKWCVHVGVCHTWPVKSQQYQSSTPVLSVACYLVCCLNKANMFVFFEPEVSNRLMMITHRVELAVQAACEVWLQPVGSSSSDEL